MSQFITDKRIQTLNYDLLSMGKELKEMNLLVKSNSTTITDLLSLIQSQNKSLTDLRGEVQSLRGEVQSLKSELEVIKKAGVNELSVESKTEQQEVIKPEDIPKDDIFRYFEFAKGWEDSYLIKKCGDSKVVYGIIFNVIPTHASQGVSQFSSHLPQMMGGSIQKLPLMNPSNIDMPYSHYNEQESRGNQVVRLRPCIRYKFKTPKSVKNSILEVQRFFQEKVDITYTEVIEAVKNKELFPDHTPFPKPKLSFSEYLLKGTVKGFFIGHNNPNIDISLDETNCVLIIKL